MLNMIDGLINGIYYYKIDGRTTDAGCIIKLPDSRRVRLHGQRKWGKMYWTADMGDNWNLSKRDAIATAAELDVVERSSTTTGTGNP